MGIRLLKAIGYGLDDVKTEQYVLKDERFNIDNFYNIDIHVDDYLKWLQAKLPSDYDPSKQQPLPEINMDFLDIELEKRFLTSSKLNNLSNMIVSNFEYGLPNVVCIVPPLNYKEWVRYNNDIDAVEVSIMLEKNPDKDAYAPRIEIMKNGFYPFNGLFSNKENGEPLKGEVLAIYRHFLFNENEIKDEFKNSKIDQFDNRTFNEMKESYNPMIPPSIINLCEFLNIFKDLNTVYSLKPMFYSYWG